MQALVIQHERSKICREYDLATWLQPATYALDKRDMVALNIKIGTHRLRLRVGRGRQEDQVIALPGSTGEPVQDVGTNEMMLVWRDVIQRKVTTSPSQIGI